MSSGLEVVNTQASDADSGFLGLADSRAMDRRVADSAFS